jgi:hypothetical protein
MALPLMVVQPHFGLDLDDSGGARVAVPDSRVPGFGLGVRLELRQGAWVLSHWPPPSRDEVIGYASSLGYIVSGPQLARWHRAGLLPRPRQRPLGRGLGTQTIYPPGTSVQMVALCQIKAEEHRLDRVAFRLWGEGFTIEPDVIRSLLVAKMNRVDAELSHASVKVTERTRVDSGPRWSLGRTGVEVMIAMASHYDSGTTAPVTMSWQSVGARPPSLKDMATLTGQALAARTRGSSVADLVAEASDDDLIRARDRSRSMLALMQSAAAPMAWL